MNTTLNEIRKHHPCGIEARADDELTGWLKLLEYLGKKKSDDEPLTFATILESNGIDDAVWCLCVLPLKTQMHFRSDVAELVLPIWEARHPDDMRPREAIQGCRDFADGKIDERELGRLAAAARAPAYAEYAAEYAAGYATGYAAANAAYAADYAANAAHAADYAANAAYAAYAEYAARDIWPEIERLFIKHFCEEN